MMRILTLLAALIVLALPAGRPALAANLFAPVITVNGLGITGFEVEQRMRFMQLMRQTGDLRAAAEQALIEDRLRVWEAGNLGLKITEAQLTEGMTEFAGRANLPLPEFIKALAQAGVEEETFRDFVRAGVLWREVVRQKYGQRITISEAEIDRALLLESNRGQGTRVLLSEVIIPAPAGREAEAMAEARRISALVGETAFAQAARSVSASPSRARGGRLDWMDVANLPPALRSVVLGLAPGRASAPIEIPGAVAVFMLRAIQDGGPADKVPQTLDFARFTLGPSGAPETAAYSAKVLAEVRQCDELYPVARGLAPARLMRETLPQGQIPQDIALALAAMDINEGRVISRGGADELLMLCGRKRTVEAAPAAAATAEGTGEEAAPSGEPDRAMVANRLTNQRLNSYAESYLADLMADAVIARP